MASTLICIVGICAAQSSEDSLKKGFEQPPSSARPRVWWHWMNGNITQEGIKLDLEWMHRSASPDFRTSMRHLPTPQVVEKRLAYMTPEWKDAFKYAISLGDQLGMEMAIAGSPGWSETGGPWVPPAEGMKKYVWTETILDGGVPFTGKLAHPPTTTGAFQNLPCSRTTRDLGSKSSRVLCGFCCHCVPNSSAIATRNGDTHNHSQRCGTGCRDVERWRPGENHEDPFPHSRWRSRGSSLNTRNLHTVRAITFVTKDPGLHSGIVSGIPEEKPSNPATMGRLAAK